MVKYSINVPVFNVEKFLSQCIDSILGQTYKNFELILIDDGSTDNSGKICDYYKNLDNRVRVFHQENKGLYCTRSTSLQKATGEYCLFVDSDDYIDINTLAEIDKVVESDRPDVVFFDYYMFSEKDKYYRNQLPESFSLGMLDEKENMALVRLFLTGNCITPLWCKAYKTSILQFEDSYKEKKINQAEDAIRMASVMQRAKNYFYLNKALYHYRLNSQSITHKHSLEKLTGYEIAWNCRQRLQQQMNINDEITLSQIAAKFINVIIECGRNIQDLDISLKEKVSILESIKNKSFYSAYSSKVKRKELPLRKRMFWFFFQRKKYRVFLLLCGMNMMKTASVHRKIKALLLQKK